MPSSQDVEVLGIEPHAYRMQSERLTWDRSSDC